MKYAFFALLLIASACRTPSAADVKEERRDDRPQPQASAFAQAEALQVPTDPETVQAIEALKVIGAASPFVQTQKCAAACHGQGPWHASIDKDLVKKWGKKMQDVEACLKATTNNKKKVNCLRATPADNAPFDNGKLGFYRAGARSPDFQTMFSKGLGPTTGPKRWKEWSDTAIMPDKATAAEEVNAADFAKLRAWVLGGMKKIDEAFGGGTVDPPVTSVCKDDVSDEMMDHIRKMKDEGWGWKNLSNDQISMFGCPERGADYDELTGPLDCFMDDAKWPLVHQKDFSKTWAERFTSAGIPITQRIRVLRELPFKSTYWLRTSADGRFSGSGLRGGETNGVINPASAGFITDLKDANRPYIGVTGPYDPGFFPDNKGFTFMTESEAWFCNQSLLEDPATKLVDFAKETTYCASSKMSVYQHVGATLGGGDYFVVRSDNYSNDDGAYQQTKDPSASAFATADANVLIYPMRESGTKFKVQPVVKVGVPFEGDWGITPSATLLTSRIAVKPEGAASAIQAGYRLRRFDVAAKTTKPLATVCLKGGKTTLSFNERVMAVHHYTDATDAKDLKMDPNSAEFKGLIENSANIWLYDMYTKSKMRLTMMKKGQFALYPHWRADGWLYFLVRDVNSEKDYIVATDAGIRMQK